MTSPACQIRAREPVAECRWLALSGTRVDAANPLLEPSWRLSGDAVASCRDGGYGFEPSTAHQGKAPLAGAFSVDGLCRVRCTLRTGNGFGNGDPATAVGSAPWKAGRTRLTGSWSVRSPRAGPTALRQTEESSPAYPAGPSCPSLRATGSSASARTAPGSRGRTPRSSRPYRRTRTSRRPCSRRWSTSARRSTPGLVVTPASSANRNASGTSLFEPESSLRLLVLAAELQTGRRPAEGGRRRARAGAALDLPARSAGRTDRWQNN
jgi:hypothetical protein